MDSGSVVTYTALRPSSQSRMSLQTLSSTADSASTGTSSLQFHVDRALATALEMEKLDAVQEETPPASTNSSESARHARPPRPSAPVPEGPSSESTLRDVASPSPIPIPPPTKVPSRPASKLSQLSQSRAQRAPSNGPSPAATPAAASVVSEGKPPSAVSRRSLSGERKVTPEPPGVQVQPASSASSATSMTSKPKSKLSQLAQSKARETPRTVTPAGSAAVSQVSAVSESKPKSKLAAMAQAKAQSSRGSSVKSVPPAITVPPALETLIATPSPVASSAGKPPSKLAQLAQAKAQQASSKATDAAPSPASSSPKPTSKLAQLAQAKAQQASSRAPDASQPAESPVSASPRPASKLAQMAQAKAEQPRPSLWSSPPKKSPAPPLPGLMVHQSHTEYLTPIANGATATTAITTTYQSLGDLAHPQRSAHATSSMHMFAPKSGEAKPSKLAMKSKKAPKQSVAESEPVTTPDTAAAPPDPMFTLYSARTRASPSAFATLLVSEEQDSSHSGHSKRSHGHEREHDKHKRKPRKSNEVTLPPGTSAAVQGFAFDVPSPDDVVFNARRGTSLAKRGSAASRLTPSTASPARTAVR